ncbi:helix-turn-helix domain-containing protein [Sandaracinobacter sp. RS1-74]|uniref:MerR family transcriptional regulator n=1 Tax=Sandaracinobacteroides sayramensis TaxID=2913411 RepID=UPI001EDAB882|nr:helix-turn-helix domain-containing protein [Sandaracinobacteroides sayramensis]MCG2840154.1 helix-turn-helix domain-containing protein [Sandaracinobacteroides sayramensis]
MKIGELAQATGTKVETVRFYEKIGLLDAPSRTRSNYRAYGPAHLGRLSFIRRARDLGFSLDQVRALLSLSDDPEQPCEAIDAVARAHLEEVDRKLADLKALRQELQHLLGQCGSGVVSTCRIVEALSPG